MRFPDRTLWCRLRRVWAHISVTDDYESGVSHHSASLRTFAHLHQRMLVAECRLDGTAA